jgi:hypothetical protein
MGEGEEYARIGVVGGEGSGDESDELGGRGASHITSHRQLKMKRHANQLKDAKRLKANKVANKRAAEEWTRDVTKLKSLALNAVLVLFCTGMGSG